MVMQKAVIATGYRLIAQVNELSEDLLNAILSTDDADEVLEAIDLMLEDLESLSAKFGMKAEELRYTGRLSANEKAESKHFTKALGTLFKQSTIDELIHAARVFKNADREGIVEAVADLGRNALLVAYACRVVIDRAKKIAACDGRLEHGYF